MTGMGMLPDADQRDLIETIRSFLQKRWPTTALMDVAMGREPADREFWPALANELGVLGLAVPEEYEGVGCSVVEVCLVLTELGRGLYMGPYLGTAALAVEAITASRDRSAMSAHLPGIARGELRATVAGLQELTSDAVLPAARLIGGQWLLTGTANHVIDALSADLLVVLADTDGGPEAFTVRSDSDQISMTPLNSLDLTRQQSTIDFHGARAERLGARGSGLAISRRLRLVTAVAQAAEDIGAAEQCLDMAVAYARDRVQFGRPIGSFQAIKHKCADMVLRIEAAKATVTYGASAVALDTDDAESSALNASAASSDAFFHAATTAIQIFGGIGYTWEHPAHLYLRRAVASRYLFGSPARNRQRVLELHLAAL
jgi:acyl-CoA dehydrogenase